MSFHKFVLMVPDNMAVLVLIDQTIAQNPGVQAMYLSILCIVWCFIGKYPRLVNSR